MGIFEFWFDLTISREGSMLHQSFFQETKNKVLVFRIFLRIAKDYIDLDYVDAKKNL